MSVLTLTAISIERWFAICHPLTFKETRKRVIVSIVVIWVGAHVMSIPRLLIFRENRDPMIPSNLTILLTSCGPDYDMDVLALNYDLFVFVTFYIVPIVVMGYTYTAIAVCLWSSIKTGQYLTGKYIYYMSVILLRVWKSYIKVQGQLVFGQGQGHRIDTVKTYACNDNLTLVKNSRNLVISYWPSSFFVHLTVFANIDLLTYFSVTLCKHVTYLIAYHYSILPRQKQ